jgi:fructose-specific phosphotransferase system IIC component
MVIAVLVGLAVDVGGSMLLGTAMAIAYGVSLARSGMDTSKIVAAMSDISPYSWFFLLVSALGAACSVLGGFICARIARRSDLTPGFVLGVVSTVTGLSLSSKRESAGVIAVLACLSFACVLLGARLGRAKHRTQTLP